MNSKLAAFWGSAMVAGCMLWPAVASAQFVWPVGVADFGDNHTLTAADLNTRFNAVGDWAMTWPAPCPEGQALRGHDQDGNRIWRCAPVLVLPEECEPGHTLTVTAEGLGCGPGVDAAVDNAIGQLALETDVAQPDDCAHGGTTVALKRGDATLNTVVVCNASPPLIAEGTTLFVCHNNCDNEADRRFPSIHAAMEWLAPRRIAADAEVVVAVEASDEPYVMAGTLEFRHPDGDRIKLVGGEPGDASDTTLSFRPEVTAVLVERGRALGFFGGFSLHSEGGFAYGVFARQGAVVVLGALRIHGFARMSLLAESNAVIFHDESQGELLATELGPVGSGPILARFGGHIRAVAGQIRGARQDGFVAQYAASVHANGSQMTGGDTTCSGYHAIGGAHIDADGSQVRTVGGEECGGEVHGYFASTAGSIGATDAVAGSVMGSGFTANDGGVVHAAGAQASDNFDGFNANRNGTLVVRDGVTTRNRSRGTQATASGFIDAEGVRSSFNASGFFASHHGHVFSQGAAPADEEPAFDPPREPPPGLIGP